MFSMSGEVRGHVIGHVSDHVISWGWYWKNVQTTFLKELINILNREQSREEDIGKKVDNFFSVKI